MANNEFELRRQAVAAGLASASSTPCWFPSAPICAISPASPAATARCWCCPGRASCSPIRATRSRRRRNRPAQIRIVKGPLVMGLLAAIEKLGVKRIGYEPARMTCDFYESLKSRLPLRASLEPVARLDRRAAHGEVGRRNWR